MPVRTKLTTKGMEDTLEEITQRGKDVDQVADQMLAAGGQVLLEGMQRRVAFLTGNLHDNLSVDGPHQDGNYHFVYVGLNRGVDANTARYGAAQEYGSSKMPAHPYIRPTVAEDMRKARAEMVKAARNALKEGD